MKASPPTQSLFFRHSPPFLRRSRGWIFTLLLLALAGPVLGDFDTGPIQQRKLFHGGVDVRPAITRMSVVTQHVTLQWSGFAGPYRVEGANSLDSTNWHRLIAPTSEKEATFPVPEDSSFIRVTGPTPFYGAAITCGDCHTNVYPSWSQTAHAGAFKTLKDIGQGSNSACLECHTAGYGLSTGFKDEKTTPFFAGVQCGNCHGPVGTHTIFPHDPERRPKTYLNSEVCGSCHSDFHHPTYDEWAGSGHSKVHPTTANYFLTYGEPRMLSCGACHSGSVRLALLKGNPLPSREEAANTPITCAVCHDPHIQTVNGGQLRNPTWSLEHFSYNTSTNTSFAAQYNPNINICGQCHNARGATWKDSARPPHHSPQYNMLVGGIGVEDESIPFIHSTHRDMQKQCTACHTHPHPVENPTEENPVITGHQFEAAMNNCQPCHSEESAVARVAITQSEIKGRIQEIRALLDTWAETQAPEPLRNKYGKVAWEYNSVGQVSNPTGSSGISGPTSAEQTSIPDAIKQARFNLYLVEHDGSYGVHNGKYARYLLQVAESKVNALLEAP